MHEKKQKKKRKEKEKKLNLLVAMKRNKSGGFGGRWCLRCRRMLNLGVTVMKMMFAGTMLAFMAAALRLLRPSVIHANMLFSHAFMSTVTHQR